VGPDYTARGIAPHEGRSGFAGSLKPLTALQFTPLGDRKLLAQVDLYERGTNSHAKAREIICYDIKTGTKAWTVETGPRVQGEVQVVDLDGDGTNEVIFGSNSSGNGYVGQDGIRDSDLSLLAVNSKGDRVWSRAFEGLYSNVLPLLARAGHTTNLIAILQAHSMYHITNAAIRSKVMQIDSAGNVLNSFCPGSCFLGTSVFDLDGDSRDELILYDCEGVLRVLDQGFRVLREKRVGFAPELRPGTADHMVAQIVKVGHMLDRGRWQIVAVLSRQRQDEFRNPGDQTKKMDRVWRDRSELYILDESLNVVAKRTLNVLYRDKVRCADMDGDGLDEILVWEEDFKILKLVKR
jgi:hypothetical protein